MIEVRIKKIIASVMNVPLETITNESSPDNIASWDSLKQMNLIMTLEQELNIEFSEEQVYELLNCELIIQAVREMSKQTT